MATNLPIKVTVSAVDEATAKVANTLRGITASAKLATDTIGKLGSAVFKVGKWAAVGLGAAAVGAGKVIHDFVESAGELEDFRKQVGLTAEAVQEWRYAAKQSGVDSESLDKAFKVFNKNLGLARANTGPLNAGLAKLNPTLLRQVKAAKSTDEALKIMMSGLAGTKTEAGRAALAMTVFGKSGVDLTRMVADGIPALVALHKEARENGLISSESATAAEEFGDSMDRLKATVQGFVYGIGAQLVPVLKPLVEKMRAWLIANREVAAQDIGDAIRAIVDAARDLWNWLDRNRDTIREFASTSFKALKSAVLFLRDNWEGILTTVKILAGVWVAGKFVTGINGALKVANALAKAFGLSVIPSQALAKAFANLIPTLVTIAPYLAPIVVATAAVIAAAEYLDRRDRRQRREQDEKMRALLGEEDKANVFRTPEAMKSWQEREADIRNLTIIRIPTGPAARQQSVVPSSELPIPAMPIMADLQSLAPEPAPVQVGGEVKIRFDNAPAGMVVETVKADNPRVPLRANVGRSKMATGAL
jgi:hypothetical protein